MQIRVGNKWYEVIDTRIYFGKRFYAYGDKVNLKWTCNPAEIKE